MTEAPPGERKAAMCASAMVKRTHYAQLALPAAVTAAGNQGGVTGWSQLVVDVGK
jgi:hypothetical protein